MQSADIPISFLLHHVIDRLHEDLFGLITRTLPSQGFEDRREVISAFIHTSRKSLCQILALLEWISGRSDAVRAVADCALFVNTGSEKLRVLLDRFFYTHREFFRKQVASRSYDLSTALDAMALGSFPRLPKEIYLFPHQGSELSIRELNHAIHSSLIIREPVPTQYSEVRVEHGLLRLTDAHNFSLCITLEAADPHAAWRLLDLELILPQSGNHRTLEPDLHQRKHLFQLISDILENDEESLSMTYKLCRSLCNGLRLEMFMLQASELAKGDWNSFLQVDKTPRMLDMKIWRNAFIIEDEFDDETDDASLIDVPDCNGCLIRVQLCGDEGLQRLSATCYASREGLGRPFSFRLRINSACLSILDFLQEATLRLSHGRLKFILRIIENDTHLKELISRGILSIQVTKMSLELHVYSTKVTLVMDCKSGLYVASCSSSLSANVMTILDDWQNMLQELGHDHDGSSILQSITQAVGNLVHAIALNYIETIAGIDYGLSLADNRWISMLDLKPCWPSSNAAEEGMAALTHVRTEKAYFPLKGRAIWWPGTKLTANQDFGLMDDWAFLEIGISKDATLEAHLMFIAGSTSVTSRSDCMPRLRARIPLAVGLGGDGKQSAEIASLSTSYLKKYLNLILEDAKELILMWSVVYTATQALGLTTLSNTLFDNIARGKNGEAIELIPNDCPIQLMSSFPGSTHDKKMERLHGLSVRNSPNECEWKWEATLPILEARASLPLPTDTSCKLEKGPLSAYFYYNKDSPNHLSVVVCGPWDPGMHVETVLTAIISAGQLSLLAARLSSVSPRKSVTHSCREWQEEIGSLLEIAMSIELPSGCNCTFAIRHTKLRSLISEVNTTASSNGPFLLHFYDQDICETNGGETWNIIEGEFNRSRNIEQLLEHISLIADGLRVVIQGLRAAVKESGKTLSKRLLGSDAAFAIVPWSLTTMAITCQSNGKVMLLSISRNEDVCFVALMRIRDGEIRAATSNRHWTSLEFTDIAAKAEFLEWFFT